MSRALIVLHRQADRDRAIKWCQQAPWGTRIEFKNGKRSLPQNDLMWAMLTDIASQKEHSGRKYPAEIWKLLFLNALGRETKFIPSLDGQSVVPTGYSSSDLSKDEMGELITLMEAWGADHGIKFRGPPRAPTPTQEAHPKPD